MTLTEYQPHSPPRRRTACSKPVAQHHSRAPVALRCVPIPPPVAHIATALLYPTPLGEDHHGESVSSAQRPQA